MQTCQPNSSVAVRTLRARLHIECIVFALTESTFSLILTLLISISEEERTQTQIT